MNLSQNSKSKITFLLYSAYGIGGSVRFVFTTANFLASKGYNITIISCYKNKDKPDFYLDPKVKLIPIVDRRKKNILKGFFSSKTTLFDHPESETYTTYNIYTDLKLLLKLFFLKTDFLICTTAYFARIAMLPHLFKRKLIMQEHVGYDIHSESFRSYLIKLLAKSKFVHCVNKKDAQTYQERLPAGVTVFTIYNSTDIIKEISNCTQKIIITTGRLAYQKNYEFLLQAFALFSQKFSDWKLMVLGSGADHQNLINTIKQLEISNNVMLVPATSSVRKYLINSSIYVCSSRYESFCISLLEAMECGLACVSMECDGPKEYIVNMSNGIVLPQNDLYGLVDALSLFAASQDERCNFGSAARATALEFSVENICKQWESFFQNN